MDKIILKNMKFYGYHGVLPEENKIGQKFTVSAELYTDLKKAGNTDCVNDTINYAEVYSIIKVIVQSKTFKLLEALAEEIAKEIFNAYDKIIEIKLQIKKPEAPVRGIFDYFAVEIRRTKDDYK